MVGVPNSRGCRNCRGYVQDPDTPASVLTSFIRKKKGCDQQRPVCGRCASLGYDCGYDDKRWTFVEQRTPSSESSRASSATRSTEITRESSDAPVPRGSVQRSLRLTAHQLEWLGQFCTQYMPQDPASTIYVDNIRPVPWFGTVLDLAHVGSTTKMALNAVALTIIGRTTSDRQFVREGTKAYGIALRETNRALQDPAKVQSDEVLACCKVLSM